MSSATLLVELPSEVRELFDERKQRSVDFENRTANRIGVYCQGFIEIGSIPRVMQAPGCYPMDLCGQAVVKDISRTGICIFYHQQLYPTQTFSVEFQGRSIKATVVRCRYLNKRCYEIGALIESVKSCGKK